MAGKRRRGPGAGRPAPGAASRGRLCHGGPAPRAAVLVGAAPFLHRGDRLGFRVPLAPSRHSSRVRARSSPSAFFQIKPGPIRVPGRRSKFIRPAHPPPPPPPAAAAPAAATLSSCSAPPGARRQVRAAAGPAPPPEPPAARRGVALSGLTISVHSGAAERRPTRAEPDRARPGRADSAHPFTGPSASSTGGILGVTQVPHAPPRIEMVNCGMAGSPERSPVGNPWLKICSKIWSNLV